MANTWNETGENRIPWPEGVAAIHAVAVYPVIQMVRHDAAKTRDCPGCRKAVAQVKFEQKLDSGHKATVQIPEAAQGEDLVLPTVAIAENLRITGARVFFRLVAGGRWIDLGVEFELPGRMAAAEGWLAARNAELKVNHGIASAHAAHAEEVTSG